MRPIDDYPITKCVKLGFEPSPELSAFVRSSILGSQGSFLKHIQSETGTRVQFRGKGSGFVDLTKGTELAPMHIFIAAFNEKDAQSAIKLAEDLIATVRANYEQQMASKTAYSTAYNEYAQYYAQYMAYYQQQQQQHH
jgi:hypothetical protein